MHDPWLAGLWRIGCDSGDVAGISSIANLALAIVYLLQPNHIHLP